ncbi:MAG: peptide-methionine (S)-S-oxide reductase MsrA [Cyclobacteriaceae bacterium]|nr:peptide-methionine (S)-S-oxide reductase MsrA [Cyclobacteriaceae bacterium]
MGKNNTQLQGSTEAIFGAGCFWCVEAVFQELKGVLSIKAGYMGGGIANPTYEQVCSGTTGHAEVARIVFDSTIISFKELLEVFWQTHDPTTLNQQGADKGTQYRSVIFFMNEEQKQLSEKYKEELNKSEAFIDPIITEITEATTYYPAEEYHQNYYLQNSNQGYCQFVIRPKMEKFRKAFASRLKE